MKTFLISAGAGAAIWVVSPWLTGQREPWDVEGPFYLVALLVAGASAGALAPRPLWAHFVGGFAGQLVYEAIALPIGPLFGLGALFLLGYSLVFAAAAAVASGVRSLITSRGKRL